MHPYAIGDVRILVYGYGIADFCRAIVEKSNVGEVGQRYLSDAPVLSLYSGEESFAVEREEERIGILCLVMAVGSMIKAS